MNMHEARDPTSMYEYGNQLHYHYISPFGKVCSVLIITAKLDSYDLVVSKFGHSLFEQFPREWVNVVKH